MGGGKELLRTDYLPPEVYTEHANWAKFHGSGFFHQRLQPLIVPFDSDFDKFAAHVAFAIRHYVIYRTDGGRFARGLVRDSGQLQKIHGYLLHKARMENGSSVRLEALLWRRKHLVPTQRWSMTIEFALAKTDKDIETELIEVPRAKVQAAENIFAEQLLHEAGLVAQNVQRQNPNQGDRVSGMVKIATELGYPRCLDLWYYGPLHVDVYLDVHTNNEFRRKMTAQTGGQFPFDGWPMQGEGQSWDSHEWRAFPYRAILRMCWGKDPDLRHAWINNILVTAEEAIFLSIKKANFHYQTIGDARALGPL